MLALVVGPMDPEPSLGPDGELLYNDVSKKNGKIKRRETLGRDCSIWKGGVWAV